MTRKEDIEQRKRDRVKKMMDTKQKNKDTKYTQPLQVEDTNIDNNSNFLYFYRYYNNIK